MIRIQTATPQRGSMTGMLHEALLILVKINLQPLSHLWVHAIKREIRQTQFYPLEFKDQCSQTLDYLTGL